MPQIERSALVFYSAQQMFDLVNAIPDYPQFLPGCSSARIINQSDTEMVASLTVSKAGIGHSFTTRNTLLPYQRIGMQLVDGPFKRLSGGWEFQPLSETACKVILKLEFEFSSKLVQFAFGKIFSELTASMVNAFTQRAKQVYGDQHG
ncbi:type II toxin-antitoxin system RatA family toxin [Rheinheimera aquimaris]|jgi:ribosome-associated toxin RatA of RatAB toxin-antitoxin module|uniref:type II toxin-antitoxin system RatA family toxin n=1 Tax=Rheinheimera aquimaris TaxID=412437 RepID=UPI0010670B6A|nr:type II toxin-antitoxin system RatA family toxin [Rheinheimera aquimaris]MCD1598838.1 type II toxin-antitoxin system RatA family toxin [Rheinheimera aquimaris]